MIEKGQYPLGITIAQGQNNGIFVADVTEESIASRSGLKCGDQLLEVKFVFQSCCSTVTKVKATKGSSPNFVSDI